MIVRVESLDDPRLDAYARLTEVQLRSKLEPAQGIFIAESDKVVKRALAGGMEPLSLLMEEKWLPVMQPVIDDMARRFPDAPAFVAPEGELRKLTGYELTRGALGAFRRPPLPTVADVCAGARRVAVLEDITNHTNVGAIFRSAAALGLDAVLVTPACYDPLYRRAVPRVHGHRVPDALGTRIEGSWPHDGISLLHDLGFKAGCNGAFGRIPCRLNDPAPCRRGAASQSCWAPKATALRRATIAQCDYTVRIPMSSRRRFPERGRRQRRGVLGTEGVLNEVKLQTVLTLWS